MVWALLPLKDFVNAKTRLSGVLSAAERRRLFHVMVEDVLDVLASHPAIEQTLIVSDDPSASLMAEHYGVECWPESELVGPEGEPVTGLTGVVDATAEQLAARGIESLLVIHGDLPLTSQDAIALLVAAHQREFDGGPGVSIAPDLVFDGSNCMICSPPNAIPFQYGQGSYEKHCAVAAMADIDVATVELPDLACDIDKPADLKYLLLHTGGATRRTFQYLNDSGIAQRMSIMIEQDQNPNNIAPDSWLRGLSRQSLAGKLPSVAESRQLEQYQDTATLAALASQLRDQGFRNTITYSRKVFIPLTHLCRDVCHYCTFAKTPRHVQSPYMSVDEVLELVKQGEAQGCKEALLTLGEKPELRYSAAREALKELGFTSTLEYVAHVAQAIREHTGLLPHINAGCMSTEELALLRPVSASMGIMLESHAKRLCEKGMPHYGSPDKDPELRLQTIERAGESQVPFTSGILIGIGETRAERIDSLLALREIHLRHGHLQEIIVQNFRAKEDTKMAQAPEPDLNELLWTIAVTRIIFGPSMSIQAPPNLSPGVLPKIIGAGINDWGGVSPVTPDFVNPEAPWPHVDKLGRETAVAGKYLHQRLTIYPAYAVDPERWLDTKMRTDVIRMIDAEGFPRVDDWAPGESAELPSDIADMLYSEKIGPVSADIKALIGKIDAGEALLEGDIVRLFQARGSDFSYVCQQADRLRQQANGNEVAYVVNRNINYTNVCYFKCQFCAFSKGKLSENLRGKPYDLDLAEISRRCDEAWQRGATEVCMQGGIHPEYTGQTYIDILQAVKSATPDMHIHAFSPLEVWQGAATAELSLGEFLAQLKAAGLNTLPGTAAEILDDEVRAKLCPDKINTAQWLEVMEEAHKQGFKTTATIMYGHVEKLEHWARHLLRVRTLQQKSGGFTEFVPLPFVHMEAPMYLKGNARTGPTFRESLLMHAVARLTLYPLIDNIQTSWVKMGELGIRACLNAGANDLGGTLMNETITRSAGSEHGQEFPPRELEQLIERAARVPRQRSTVYGEVATERVQASYDAPELVEPINTPVKKYQRDQRRKGDLVVNNITAESA